MQTSPNIGALCAALAKAKSQYSSAKKDAKNPFFKSDYLTLAGAHGAADPALSANGLAVLQSTCFSDTCMTLHTVLMHESGEWVKGSYPVNPVKNDPQGIGSALTYARRYSYMTIVGLAAFCLEDDDGNAASDYAAQKSAPPKVTAPPVQSGSVSGPAVKAPSPETQALTAEYEKVEKMLIAKMGKEESAHQINAIKKKNGTNYAKALSEIKALNDSTPVKDF